MANVVEIQVTGKNLTKPAFDAAVADARAMGTKVGEQYSTSLSDKVSKDLPAKIKAPLDKTSEPARQSGTKVGAAFGAAFSDNFAEKVQTLSATVDDIVGGHGKSAGTAFSAKFGDQVKANITTGSVMAALGPAGIEALAKTSGDRSGFDFTEAMGGRVRASLPKEVEQPLEDSGKKAGAAAGKAAGGAISPLIIGAFAAAATVGPAAVLGATAFAVIGAGALIAKGNAQVAASYQRLGTDAASAVTQATAPLVPQLLGAVGVLDDGIAKIEPELKSVFAAVAPDARDLAGGLVSLVGNALPGLASGLRAIAPFTHEIAADFGKIGSGAGGFFQALGGGAAGGSTAFTALATAVEHLLPDLGQIIGALANGLGPALHDVVAVVDPVAAGLAAVVKAFPPGAIRAAADATLLLFGAFKLASLAGVLAEGATFLTFLRGEAVAATAATEATGALAAAQSAAAASATAMGAAASAAIGPWGLLAAGIWLATENIRIAGVRLGDLNPVTVYKDWDAAEHTHATAVGQTATVIAGAARAVDQYAKVLASGVPTVGELSSALSTAATAADQSAQSTAAAAVAALGGRDGSDALTMALDGTITAFEAASSQASAYKVALDASFNKFGDYSAAQAAFTTDLATTSKELTHGRDEIDLNTAAGAANFTALKNLSDLNETRAEKLLTETGSQDKANQSLQQGAVAIDNLARSAGFGKADIDKLNLALYGTKNIGDIKVSVSADTSGVVQHVKNVISWIDGQSASFYVNTTGPGARAAQAGFAHGGIVGAAATGGPRSNLTWVGEHGPELLPLPPGTQVHSNPDSMRMAAEAAGSRGGWDGVVRLEVTGDDLIAQWIRNHVRVVAGNAANSVQRAFGQSF